MQTVFNADGCAMSLVFVTSALESDSHQLKGWLARRCVVIQWIWQMKRGRSIRKNKMTQKEKGWIEFKWPDNPWAPHTLVSSFLFWFCFIGILDSFFCVYVFYRRALLSNGNLIVNRFCCGTQTAQGTEEKEEVKKRGQPTYYCRACSPVTFTC